MENGNVARAKLRALEIHPGPLPDFTFPPEHHLLITTGTAVRSLDAMGLKNVFVSSLGGIVAAKESDDGVGFLAVADGFVVVIRKPGDVDHRYKLKATEGCAGLLSFANNSKDLFFTTAMQTSLRRYSVDMNKLLEYHCTHPSPPTALAVSFDSTYVVSASASPPLVYLQNCRKFHGKIQFKPRHSIAPITVASFHPERAEVFLLAYADGTLSIHTASQIVLRRSTGSDGSLGHFKRAHTLTSTYRRRRRRKSHIDRESVHEAATIGDRSVGITAAVFIKSYKLRTVSVAGDGRCRIVDFERGVAVIRSWSAQAACTSLAVFTFQQRDIALGNEGNDYGMVASPRKAEELAQNSNYEPNFIIAVGRVDGILLMFDAAGLLRFIKKISYQCEPLIDLAWMSDARDRSREYPTNPVVRDENKTTTLHPNFEITPAPHPSQCRPLLAPKVEDVTSNKQNDNPAEFRSKVTTASGEIGRIETPPRDTKSIARTPICITQPKLSKSPNLSDSPRNQRLRLNSSRIRGPGCSSYSNEVCYSASHNSDSRYNKADTEKGGTNSESRKVAKLYKNPAMEGLSKAECIQMRNRSRQMPGSWVDSSSSLDSVIAEPSSPNGDSKMFRPSFAAQKMVPPAKTTVRAMQISPSPSKVSLWKDRVALRTGDHISAKMNITQMTKPTIPIEQSDFLMEQSGNPIPINSRRFGETTSSDSDQLPSRSARCIKKKNVRINPEASAKVESPDDSATLLSELYSPSAKSIPVNSFTFHPVLNTRPCESDCATVIREELALVRAEIAALRKVAKLRAVVEPRISLKSSKHHHRAKRPLAVAPLWN